MTSSSWPVLTYEKRRASATASAPSWRIVRQSARTSLRVDRPQRLAGRVEPLVEPEAEAAARDERLRLAPAQVVEHLAVDPLDERRVLEAGGRQERNPAAGPLDQRWAHSVTRGRACPSGHGSRRSRLTGTDPSPPYHDFAGAVDGQIVQRLLRA